MISRKVSVLLAICMFVIVPTLHAANGGNGGHGGGSEGNGGHGGNSGSGNGGNGGDRSFGKWQ